ncbi:MAG: hypothetical protein ACLFQB_02400 [Chitinispirillaceae bacterium]
MKKNIPFVILLSVLFLFSCAANQPPFPAVDPPGFWLGLWHGFISPITFIISLFTQDVEIYAFPNSGGWYDFGFMLGIGGFSGGIFAGSRKK